MTIDLEKGQKLVLTLDQRKRELDAILNYLNGSGLFSKMYIIENFPELKHRVPYKVGATSPEYP